MTTTNPPPRTWNSSIYAEARPLYPDSLFTLLSSLTPRHDLAWDVGTGNGQAAVALADHYKKVIATDLSENQLLHAFPRPNVIYAKMNAEAEIEEIERIVGEEGSVDLVVVATALHWFNLDIFFPRVQHVLRKPGGVFAAWTYTEPTVTPEVDAVTAKLMSRKAAAATGQLAEIFLFKYASIPFPFEPVLPNNLGTEQVEFGVVVKQWNFGQFFLLWRSGSATKDNSIESIIGEYLEEWKEAWGPLDHVRPVSFPIWLRVGKVASA